ncbi:MACPF domain-containing protein At1g14780 isoform X2 [Rutidosis leptorrhynchoides]
MSEFFNKTCSVPGKIPNGLFNAMFGFQSGSWATDAANTKFLGLDGYFIMLFKVHLDRYPLILSDQVRNAVPSTWDPLALARFIENYGTHIVVGITIGGKDVIMLKQNKSSPLEPSQLKNHLEDLGDQLFNGACAFSPHQPKSKELKNKTFSAFNTFFDPEQMLFNGFSSSTTKNGITIMSSKRGGDLTSTMHCEWLSTVPSMPDAIAFDFIPITSLLHGVPGMGFLSHAINLYLRYKPPISDLQYFLDFQAHKYWAPVHNDLSLGPTTNRAIKTPALNISLMGPKLYVNSTQVTITKKPVTGMRLYLEGMKCNRLAIHLQHLSDTPVLFQDKISEPLHWRGSEEILDPSFFEPIQWKKFSHVSTAPVKYNPEWASPEKDASFIVTGAHLHVKKHDSKNILHLRLLYSRVSSSCIFRSSWTSGPLNQSHKSSFMSAISTSFLVNQDKELRSSDVVVDSGIYPNGPPVEVPTQKLLKFVDMTEICRGPRDNPGHWLVTGAKLYLDKGKIRLLVKFSLLNIC